MSDKSEPHDQASEQKTRFPSSGIMRELRGRINPGLAALRGLMLDPSIAVLLMGGGLLDPGSLLRES